MSAPLSVIAQQYPSATFVSLQFHSAGGNLARVGNITVSVFCFLKL
jgi:polyisoprenoid-binding protein YceI